MATKTVNLDALIPRDDLTSDDKVKAGGNPRGTISITDLNDGFFAHSLRKPDFQRETTHWDPPRIVELVKAFLDGDLIPAVILWERGRDIFVIDGAHRLSALIAWVKDDYGDKADSIKFFGANLPEEQIRIADRTRKLMRKEVGSYAEFQGWKSNNSGLAPEKLNQLTNLGKNALIAQWVTATEPSAAEASFFKINQAAQPIDPTERRILQSRRAANSIAARAIVRGGAGHPYWRNFGSDVKADIEREGAEIYRALYSPPLNEPVNSLDMPIAGKGYSALPFVFDLVNLCNGIALPSSTADKKIGPQQPVDADGYETIKCLRAVTKRVSLVSTNDRGSLGFHPAVYYYAMSGNFLPNAFLAAVEFAKALDEKNKKKAFTNIRQVFESYLFENKVFISLTVTKLGSAGRSLNRLRDLYWRIFEELERGTPVGSLTDKLVEDQDFAFLKAAQVPTPRAGDSQGARKGKVPNSTKSAVFIRDAMKSVLRCSICGGAVHSNSMSHDHTTRVREGGSDWSGNLTVTHPFCNTGVKS